MLLATLFPYVARCDAVPDIVRWHSGAYTNWNLALLFVLVQAAQGA